MSHCRSFTPYSNTDYFSVQTDVPPASTLSMFEYKVQIKSRNENRVNSEILYMVGFQSGKSSGAIE